MSNLSILFAVISLTASIGSFVLGFFILKRGQRNALHLSFMVFVFLVAFWTLVNSAMLFFKNELLLKATYALGTFLPLAGLIFIYSFRKEKMPPMLKGALGAFCFLGATFSFSPWFLREIVLIQDAGFEAHFGILFAPWAAIMFSQVALAFYKMVEGYIKAAGRQKTAFEYLLLGMGLAGGWAAITSIVLPPFGFLTLSNTDAPSMLLMVLIISYAVFKHRLLQVRVLISRALLFSLIIGATSLVLAAFIVVGAWFFSSFGPKGIAFVSLAVAAAAFQIGRIFFIERRELESARQELEEAKQILEIRVRARTKELEEINAKLEKLVEQRTMELRSQIEELERFHKLVVGREMKMIQLKQEIESLKSKMDKSRKVNISFRGKKTA